MKRIIFLATALLAWATSLQAQILDTAKLDSLFAAIETFEKGMGVVSIFQDGKEV